MKKSTVASLLIFLLLIPATMYLGNQLPGRKYYITATLLIIELMIPFFLSFEGRKPQARELVLVAVLCALAIAARVAIPIPHFKANYAVIMLAGAAFGFQNGFIVGAISAFASNFFYTQGAFTPWQMIGYGIAGMLFGLLFDKCRIPAKSWLMAIIGFAVVVFVVGPILDSIAIFMGLARPSLKSFLAFFASGFAVNCSLGLATAFCLLAFGKPMMAILDRIKLKYGVLQ